MILNVSTDITFVPLQIPPTRSPIRYKIWTFIKKSKNFRYIRNGYYASNDKISLETLTTFFSIFLETKKQKKKKRKKGWGNIPPLDVSLNLNSKITARVQMLRGICHRAANSRWMIMRRFNGITWSWNFLVASATRGDEREYRTTANKNMQRQCTICNTDMGGTF